MLAQTVINDMMEMGGFEWMTALKSGALQNLRAEGYLQMGLFDERNIFEFESELYPGERLVACRNEMLGSRRATKRNDMIKATCVQLDKVKAMVERGRLREEGKIGLRVGRIVNKYKMAKHFRLEFGEGRFSYEVDEGSVREESALDGV